MALLGRIAEAGLVAWFLALAGLIVVQLWRGRIISAGVLATPFGPPVAVARLQLVLITNAVAAGYAVTALTGPAGAPLPEPPMMVVIALLGSNGFYLGGKSGLMRRGERA